MKKAIVTGIFGQDGSYMAELLNSKGYVVIGVVKQHAENLTERTEWIKKMIPNVLIIQTDIADKKKVDDLIKNVKPDEIYNFVGYTNVFNPWENLTETFNLNCTIPQNFLESIVNNDKNIKFFNASSCLIYGRTKDEFQNEKTSFSPLYPYGITKLYSQNLISEFRERFDIFCCSGVFFNHESERRGKQFFTMKIIDGILGIINNKKEKIKVGDLNSLRDMGYAPDFMEAVFKMMQLDKCQDLVIGTGTLITMREFVEKAFKYVGLNWEEHIEYDESFLRKCETQVLRADISKIKELTGWTPKYDVESIIKKMIDNKIIK